MTSKLNTLLRNVLFTILIVFAFFVCLELLARGVIGLFPSMQPEQIMLPTLQDGPIVSDNIKVDRIEWNGSPITPIEGKILGIVTNPGEYQVTVVVYDEEGNSNSTSFTLTVESKDEVNGYSFGLIFIILCETHR